MKSGIKFTIRRPNGQSMEFDAVLSETYSDGAETTDHPIDAGADVSDHVRVLPLTFGASVVVTTAPQAGAADAGWARVQRVLSFVRACLGELLTVQTTLRGVYTNVVLLRMPHERTGRGHVEIPLSFKQARLANAQTITIAASSPPVQARVGLASQADVGRQAALDAKAVIGAAGVDSDTSLAGSILISLGVI